MEQTSPNDRLETDLRPARRARWPRPLSLCVRLQGAHPCDKRCQNERSATSRPGSADPTSRTWDWSVPRSRKWDSRSRTQSLTFIGPSLLTRLEKGSGVFSEATEQRLPTPFILQRRRHMESKEKTIGSTEANK